MVVRLRLQRFGQRNTPFYRLVAADSRFPRDGRFLERLGHYNPIPNKFGIKEVAVNVDRIHHWLTKGAQPSDRVAWLLGNMGILPPAPVRESKETAIPKYLKEKK